MEHVSIDQRAHEIAMLYLSKKDLLTLSTRQITERYLTSYNDAKRVLEEAKKEEAKKEASSN